MFVADNIIAVPGFFFIYAITIGILQNNKIFVLLIVTPNLKQRYKEVNKDMFNSKLL